MQDGDGAQGARKRFLARFVAKDAAPEKRPRAAADQRKAEQRRFRNPLTASLRAQLVKAEQHERPCVEEDERAEDEDGGGHGTAQRRAGWFKGRLMGFPIGGGGGASCACRMPTRAFAHSSSPSPSPTERGIGALSEVSA